MQLYVKLFIFTMLHKYAPDLGNCHIDMMLDMFHNNKEEVIHSHSDYFQDLPHSYSNYF